MLTARGIKAEQEIETQWSGGSRGVLQQPDLEALAFVDSIRISPARRRQWKVVGGWASHEKRWRTRVEKFGVLHLCVAMFLRGDKEVVCREFRVL